MLSGRIEPRSIATQLVIFFTAAATLLLCLAMIAFYSIVARHTENEDNAVLMDRVSALTSQLQNTDSINVFTEQIERVHSSEAIVLWTRLLDAKGNTVAETPAMDRFLPVSMFPPASNSQAIDGAIHVYAPGERLFALKVTAATGPDGADYTIQVAQDRWEDETFRSEFQVLLVLVLGAGIVVAGVIAVSLTKWGLRPVSTMASALQRIGPKELHERMRPENWPPELKPLAASFDGMLARLEDSFARLSQFSADIAHELRTPVGNILAAAQVTLSHDRAPEDYRSTLESIVADCERLGGIVDNLLFLARAEASEDPVERKTFEARPAVEKIANYYDAVAEERGVKIQCDGTGKLLADPMLFDRALGNVVENALRHTPSGGQIEIGIQQANGTTTVSVTDTGTGIRREDLPRVFDRFYRGDPSRSSAGTGLGLALVRSILDLHQGKAEIQSEAGQGTVVRLVFPLTEKR